MSTPVISAGGNDSLFKLAENAALDDNRIMPSERVYPKSSKTISINEAISLMKKRKSDPSLRIKGGLDDTTDAVRKYPNKVKELSTAEQAETTNAKPEVPSVIVSAPGTDAKLIKSSRGRTSNLELMGALTGLQNELAVVHKTIDYIYATGFKSSKSISKEVSAENLLQEFKANSHAVTFMLNGMEFTIKCLNMVKDPVSHTIVFVFLDNNDSFFTPPIQSELKIRYDNNEEPGKLYYFGMCFSLKQLGLKFLGFIYDDKIN